jgi:hypothetical protein
MKNAAWYVRFSLGYWMIVLFGGLVTAFGTWLTWEGGQKNAEIQSKKAETLLNQTKEDNARFVREMNNKMQDMLLALRAAKQEETRNLTEEKIKIIQNDFAQWADDFTKRRQDKQRQFDEARSASTEKETQISGQSMPLFSFTVRFAEEAFRAYAKRTDQNLNVDMPALPQNFYAREPPDTQRIIQFTHKANWRFEITAGLRPAWKTHQSCELISQIQIAKAGLSFWKSNLKRGNFPSAVTVLSRPRTNRKFLALMTSITMKTRYGASCSSSSKLN